MIYADIFLTVLELAFAAGLYALAIYAEKALNPFWRILYAIPLIVCGVAAAVMGYEISMIGVYIGAALMLTGFIMEKRRTRHAGCVMAAVCMLLSVLACNVNSGYRAPDYVADFKRAFAELKTHYMLAEYKGINWDALYEEYLPQFKEADKAHDEVENAILWRKFTYEFHDGHVQYSTSENIGGLACDRYYGNDYGLTVMMLNDGKYVAVNVEKESEAENAGIHNGTVITEWGGRSVEETEKNAEVSFAAFPVEENEKFYKGILAAGVGGEQVRVTYIGDDGKEKKAELKKLGAYAKRMHGTLDILHMGMEGDNLSWHHIDDNTECLRIKQMMYDSESYSNGDHSKMEQEIKSRLLELRQSGIDNLVIDLRSNGGGSPQFIMAIAGLLAPKGEHVYAYDGVWDNDNKEFKKDPDTGKYVVGEGLMFEGEDLWGHGQIVILVNSETVSAGDHLTKMMGEYENVTVIGFTESMSSGQGVRAAILSEGQISYSAVPVLTADGEIFVDTDKSRKSTIPLDVKVPFDEEAVHAIFDEGRDYILDYAVEYLKESK